MRRRIVAAARSRCLWWGMLSAAALPPWHVIPMLLFSVPGFLREIDSAPNWRIAAFRAWVFGFGLAVVGLYWITEPMLTEVADFWWLVPFADPLLAAAVAFYTIIPALAAYAVPPGIGRVLAFAGAWILSNLLQQFAFSGFPWNFWGTDWAIPGRLGDIFIQPASLGGVYGLTFATVLLASLPLFGRRGLVVLAAAMLLWAGFGWARLQEQVAPGTVKLAMVQPDFAVPGLYDRASLMARWETLLRMSRAGVQAGATAIVWPEGASPWQLASDANARAALAAVTGNIPVLAGGYRIVGPGDVRNSLTVTAGPAPPLAAYDKWKLVPFGEYMPAWIPVKITPDVLGSGFTPGPGPRTITAGPLPPFDPLICYEAIFSGEIVQPGARPAWMLNITDDSWFGTSAGPQQAFAAARLRAVEEGLPLARDANSGITAMIDAFGRVNAIVPLNREVVLLAILPGALPETIYGRYGLWIPLWVGLLGLITGLFAAVSRVSKIMTIRTRV
jgi:apolipoprotein N-acyltransferase